MIVKMGAEKSYLTSQIVFFFLFRSRGNRLNGEVLHYESGQRP